MCLHLITYEVCLQIDDLGTPAPPCEGERMETMRALGLAGSWSELPLEEVDAAVRERHQ